MTEEIGWAVVSGRILINTVSETRRAAIVNYLVVHRGIAITTSWTDDDIERCWSHWGGYQECRQVRIGVVVHPASDMRGAATPLSNTGLRDGLV